MSESNSREEEGNPLQEHDRRRFLRTGFAIENSDTISRHAVIGRCRGRQFLKVASVG